MCGAFISFTPEQLDEIRDIVAEVERRTAMAEGVKQGEVRPTNCVPVLVPDGSGTLEPRPMTWGFAGWSRKRKDGKGMTKPNTVFNTRGENALQSQFWADSMRERRVIVPTSGFIEWRHADKKDKTRYLFKVPGDTSVYLAGVYQVVEGEGGPEERFSIVTTDANPYINEVHDRMPVVLLRHEFAQWLYASDYMRLIDRCKLRLEKSVLAAEPKTEQISMY